MKKVFFQIVLPLLGIAGILGFITLYKPVTIKQQQAAWQVNDIQTYPCGQYLKVQLIPSYAPACDSNGYNSSLTSYQTSVQVKALNDASFQSHGQYHVHWKWASYWCSTEDPHAPCIASNASATTEKDGDDGLTGNNSIFVTAESRNIQPTGQFAGLACGYYQTDFAFYVTDNNTNQTVCGISINDPASNNQNAAWCHTGTTCTVPPATPTTGVTVTPTVTPTTGVTVTPTATPTSTPDCDGDTDTSDPSEDQECTTPTPTATPTPTGIPTATPTSVSNNNCDDETQVATNGSNNNSNCNQNNNNNNNNQSQSQTQNNNQTVNITLGNGQQQQQQVLAATAPTQLPSTGAGSDVLFGLLALVPVGWKIRKLV